MHAKWPYFFEKRRMQSINRALQLVDCDVSGISFCFDDGEHVLTGDPDNCLLKLMKKYKGISSALLKSLVERFALIVKNDVINSVAVILNTQSIKKT